MSAVVPIVILAAGVALLVWLRRTRRLNQPHDPCRCPWCSVPDMGD